MARLRQGRQALPAIMVEQPVRPLGIGVDTGHGGLRIPMAARRAVAGMRFSQ
jgi:hypothetical protein